MDRTEQQKEFETWKPLIDYVVKKHFRWALRGKVGRHIDHEDLFQEGAKGLLRAMEDYDPSRGVAKKTFYYTLIRNYAADYVDKNLTTITHPCPASVFGHAILDTQGKLSKAFDCYLLSEIGLAFDREPKRDVNRQTLEDVPALVCGNEFEDEVATNEFNRTLLQRLKRRIGRDAYVFIEKYADGRSLRSLALEYGCSQKKARELVDYYLEQAVMIAGRMMDED